MRHIISKENKVKKRLMLRDDMKMTLGCQSWRLEQRCLLKLSYLEVQKL